MVVAVHNAQAVQQGPRRHTARSHAARWQAGQQAANWAGPGRCVQAMRKLAAVDVCPALPDPALAHLLVCGTSQNPEILTPRNRGSGMLQGGTGGRWQWGMAATLRHNRLRIKLYRSRSRGRWSRHARGKGVPAGRPWPMQGLRRRRATHA